MGNRCARFAMRPGLSIKRHPGSGEFSRAEGLIEAQLTNLSIEVEDKNGIGRRQAGGGHYNPGCAWICCSPMRLITRGIESTDFLDVSWIRDVQHQNCFTEHHR